MLANICLPWWSVSCSSLYMLCCCCFFFFVFVLMIRRPPRSTLDRSSAASDVYKRQELKKRIYFVLGALLVYRLGTYIPVPGIDIRVWEEIFSQKGGGILDMFNMFSGGALPVSYTHLRAHETVLDLVCRLLLEKNTHQSPPYTIYLTS